MMPRLRTAPWVARGRTARNVSVSQVGIELPELARALAAKPILCESFSIFVLVRG